MNKSFRSEAIGTAKFNGVNPQAWLSDVLDRIDELLPWAWAEMKRLGGWFSVDPESRNLAPGVGLWLTGSAGSNPKLS